MNTTKGHHMNTRPTPPDLEFRAPDCPLCDTETGSDGDGFWCETCGATWGHDGTDGEWDDQDAKQCESTWASPSGLLHRCMYADGHERFHTSGQALWSLQR